MTRSQKRQAFKRAVRSLVREVIAEGQHQDGIGYWDNFATPEEAVQDFVLYVQNLEPEHLKQHVDGTDYYSRPRPRS